jgi:hypothetical protein
MGERQYATIEQNPEKPNRWASLPGAGIRSCSSKDAQANRFVGVAVDGEGKEYGGGRSRGQQAADRD